MIKTKGVDISYCQSGIDYSALKNSGVKFAIIRAGIGTRTDSLLDNHVSGCTANDIAYGFYWYSVASSMRAAKAEAAACLKAIARYDKPAYPVFYDMEEKSQIDKLDSKTRTDIALAFCEEIERGGYPAGVYANPSWLECYYEKSRIVGKYDIWLAHWTNSPDIPSSYKYGQTMWQWGLDNIGMDIDGDICFINYPTKTAYWYDTHTAAQLDKPDEPEQPDVPEHTQPTAELREGDEVTLKNAPLFISSTAKNKSTSVSGTYYIYCDGVINNRVRITTPKGCADCTGWVNVADCKTDNAVSPSQPEPTQPTAELREGDEVTLKNAPLYGASTSESKATTVSGTYWVHSDGIINGRIRITTPKGCADCTGWVNVADCKAVTEHTTPENKSSIDDIACAVIRGEYGNGEERKTRLESAGYNYAEVQARVNEILS